MTTNRLIFAAFLTCVFTISLDAQDAISPSAPASPNETIPLTVPKGTAVQVVVDKELKIQNVGQSVHGRVAEPVYAFDKLVVPVGTEVTGQITQLEGVSSGRRTLDALNADFTPSRKVQIEFNALEPSDGRRIPIQPIVTPGSGQVIQFATAADPEKKRA